MLKVKLDWADIWFDPKLVAGLGGGGVGTLFECDNPGNGGTGMLLFASPEHVT